MRLPSIAARDELNYGVTQQVRRLSLALAHGSGRYLQQFGVTAGERTLLELLASGGPQAVPLIASHLDVSRQNIQVKVDAMRDKGLLETLPNPAHKRSKLVRPSPAGRKTMAAICRHETALLRQWFGTVPGPDLEITRRTLQTLIRYLE